MHDTAYLYAEPAMTQPRRRPGRRRIIIAALAAAAVIGVIATVALSMSPTPKPGAATPGSAAMGTADAATPTATEQTDGEQGGDGAPAAPEPPAGPQGDPSLPTACQGVDPAQPVAVPDPVKLSPGVSTGSFTIYNCATEAMDWTAKAKYTVTLSETSGQLEPGESQIIDFSADLAEVATGPFSFKIKVMNSLYSTYVDVQGTKLIGEEADA